ncbi:MAG TPA: hypothetical protein VER55_05085, partial [Ardenticatenaceae bacterium]|nr:hypothetical protein [Ardenticatenaceae bacterium]
TSAWIVLAGIFAGLAFGIKYQAFIVPLSLALLLAWWHRARPRGALRQLVLFGLVVALIWLPWPLRNVALTGDPVYPFGSIGRGWDSFRTAAFADSRMDSDPARLLALPLSLTLGLNGITVYDGRSGPLFLTLLPLALWFLARRHGDRKERAVLGALLAVAALHGLLWTAGVATSAATSQSRFLLPLFVLLSPLIAWGWEALAPLTTERSQPIGLVNLLVGVALALSAVHATLETVAAAPFAQLAGLESREDYLDRRLGSLWTASTAVNRLPADSRVLLLWEPRSYYIARPSDPDIILDEFDHRLWLAGGDIRGVAEGLRPEGFTHLLVYERGVEFLQTQSTDSTTGNWARLDAFLDAYARETWRAEDGSYALYELVVR